MRIGQHDECLTHMMRLHFALQQIASHIAGLIQSARIGTLGNEVICQQPGPNAVGIYAIDPNTFSTQFQRQLLDEEKAGCFWQTISPKAFARIDGLLGNIEQDLPTPPLIADWASL